MYAASEHGHDKVVEILITAKADMNIATIVSYVLINNSTTYSNISSG